MGVVATNALQRRIQQNDYQLRNQSGNKTHTYYGIIMSVYGAEYEAQGNEPTAALKAARARESKRRKSDPNSYTSGSLFVEIKLLNSSRTVVLPLKGAGSSGDGLIGNSTVIKGSTVRLKYEGSSGIKSAICELVAPKRPAQDLAVANSVASIGEIV